MADQNFRVKRGLEVGIGATVLTTTATGNIGIGSTNPQERLDVQGGNGFVRIGQVYSTFNGITLNNSTVDSDYNFISSPADRRLFINSPTGINFRIADTDRLLLSSAGNLGINSTTPTSRLDVVGDAKVSGVITATTFSGNATTATFATNAGISTNLKGGLAGNIPYQSAADTTVFLANGSAGSILQSNGVGNAPSWVSAAPSNAITGLTIRDEGTIVGTANSITQLNFVGNIVSAAATAGIATITVTFPDFVSTAGFATVSGISTNVIGGIASVTQLNVSGVSTISVSSSSDALRITQLGAGNAIVVEDETNPDSTPFIVRGDGSVGVGTTNPLQKLHVLGNFLVAAGSSTAQHITQKAYELNNGTLSWEGSAGQLFSITNNLTSGSIFSVNDVSGIPSIDVNADGTIALAPYGANENIGIGTTRPTSKFHLAGNGLIVGVLTATTFSGTLSGYASSAGITTNLKGGSGGTIVYQSAVDTTAFLANGSSGQVLQANGGTNAPSWVNAAPSNAITGLTIRDEGTIVSTANSFSQLNFVGNIVSVAGTGPSGIATITFADFVSTSGTSTSVIGGIGSLTQLNVSGVSTFSSNINLNAALSLPQNPNGVGFGTTTANPQYAIRQTMGDNDGWQIFGESPSGTNTGSLVIEVNDDNAEEKIVFRNRRNYSGAVIGVTTFLEMTNSANIMRQVPLLINSSTLTGTASQPLQVTGGGYFSGTVAIGLTNPAVSAGSSARLNIQTSDGTRGIRIENYNASHYAELHLAASAREYRIGVGGASVGDLGSSFYLYDANSGTTRLLVNSSGNLGINSTVPTSRLTVQGDVLVSGVSTFTGAITGTISTATKLQTARTFEITGDVVASAISFDGSGNVSLAATIQPNSVGLGTDTTGDYVQTVTGTANQITVTSGTGEGSTPTLSFPNQVTLPQDLTVTRDVQINRNLNVTGNITIGGTSATLFSQELKIFDPDIVLGFRTDALGNDVSNDNTANHGGIAIASTEGTPLVQLYNVAIGETNPATYKKIMWFKSGSFSGLGTDAWLMNYAVGIGSTQFPVGTRLAAGNVQFTQNDLAAVTNINASGITTSSRITLNGANSTATGGGQIYLNGASGNRIDFNQNGVAAPAFTTRSAGTKIVLYPQVNATNVDYALGIEGNTLWYSVPQAINTNQHRWYAGTTQLADLKGTGELVIGSTTLTGTASQNLQVTGGAYVSGNLGVGVTNPESKLHLKTTSGGTDLLLQTAAGLDNSITFREDAANYFRILHEGSAGTNPNNLFKIQTATSTGGIDNDAITIKQSGNVGIGTTNPSEKLDVWGKVQATWATDQHIKLNPVPGAGYFDVSNTTTYPSIIFRQVGSGGTQERMRITSAGDVGIGTDNPQKKLHVYGEVMSGGNVSGSYVVNLNPSGSGPILEFGDLTDTDKFMSLGAYSGTNNLSSSNRDLRIFSTAAPNAFTLQQSTGNIGINTTSPQGTLQVGAGTSTFIVTGIGSVGIGLTNPSNRLTVYGTQSDTTPILALLSGNQQTGFNNGAQIAFGYDGTPTYQHFIQTRHNAANSNNAIDFYVSDGTQNNTLTSGSVHTMSLVSGSVGIQTTAPQGTLQVGAGTSTFIVTGIGSVGIGTTNPTSALTISKNQSGTVNAGSHLNFENPASSNAQTTLAFTFGGTVRSNIRVDGNGNFVLNANNNNFYFNNDFGNNTFAFLTSGSSTPWMQVTGGNKVGIATNNATATLQVKDALAFETTNTTTTNTNQVAVDTFATATFRSAKYQVQVTCPGQISTLGGITTGGRGYTAGTYNVTFTTSSGNGSAAQGTLTVSNGTVGALSVISGGTGYVTGDVLTASGGSGLQVSVGSTASPSGAILTLGAITSAGIGYTAGVGVGTTTLTFLGGTGSGATGLATVFDGVITSSTLLQQPTTGTGGTTYYSGSNYSTASVLSVDRTTLTNTITTITGSVGVSTFTSLTAHGIGVSDVVRVSSTSNGLTAGTDYYVVSVPSTTTFTLGTSVGIGTTFTAGTNLAIGFYRNSSANGGQVAYTNAITGVSTNFQASDLMVLQNGTTADFIEYATIANSDILGTFASDISGANARLLFTPTYPNNNVKVARQAITV